MNKNNIILYTKSIKSKYKTYKIIKKLYIDNKYKILKFGIYNPILNIYSCMFIYILKYLKQGFLLSKNLIKITLYYIKYFL